MKNESRRSAIRKVMRQQGLTQKKAAEWVDFRLRQIQRVLNAGAITRHPFQVN